jgi:hypothetical protein
MSSQRLFFSFIPDCLESQTLIKTFVCWGSSLILFFIFLILIVAVWSGVNVAGVRLRDINPTLGSEDDKEHWGDMHRQVVQR